MPDHGSHARDPGEGRVISLSYSLNRADLFWYNLYFSRYVVVAGLAFLALFIAGFILTVRASSDDLRASFMWLDIGLGAGFSVCVGIVTSIALQVYVLKSDVIERAMTWRSYDISHEGISVFNRQAKIDRPWTNVRNVYETKHGFYVRTGDRLAIIIPVRELKDSGKLQNFREILENRLA